MTQPMHSDPRAGNPRLTEVREMLKELDRLKTALHAVEGQLQMRPPGSAPVVVDLNAVEGWVLSIIESYISLFWINVSGGGLSGAARMIKLSSLRNFIDQQVAKQRQSKVGAMLGGMH